MPIRIAILAKAIALLGVVVVRMATAEGEAPDGRSGGQGTAWVDLARIEQAVNAEPAGVAIAEIIEALRVTGSDLCDDAPADLQRAWRTYRGAMPPRPELKQVHDFLAEEKDSGRSSATCSQAGAAVGPRRSRIPTGATVAERAASDFFSPGARRSCSPSSPRTGCPRHSPPR